jgi:hypothetical protein
MEADHGCGHAETASMPMPAVSTMLTLSRLNALSLPAKIGSVVGGYVVALLIAAAAVAVRMAFTDGPEAQASSGMYAFGDAVVFVGIFGVCALAPTGAALLFLRTCDSIWKVVSVLGVATASTGIAATIVYAIGRHATTGLLAAWSAFAVLRILVAPLFVLTFTVCAFFSPHRAARLAFVIAGLMEAVVSAYIGIVWFLPLLTAR